MRCKRLPGALLSGLVAVLGLAPLFLPFGTGSAHAGGSSSYLWFTVTRSDDANVCNLGDCSLRGAIGEANLGIFNNIRFADSVSTVNLTSMLPMIDTQGTWIDGYTGTHIVVVNASGIGYGPTFQIRADDVTISNLSVINSKEQDVFVDEGKDAKIVYDYLGLPPDATNCSYGAHVRDGFAGVRVDSRAGSGSPGGGTAYVYSNVIGCHSQGSGVEVDSQWTYVGQDPSYLPGPNYIGLTWPDGHSVPNRYGVNIFSVAPFTSANNTVYANNIAFNTAHGVVLQGPLTFDNFVDSAAIYRNGGAGICEGDGAGPNAWDIVSIYDNGGLGIDKNAACAATPLPAPEPTGPYPAITSVNRSTGVVRGTSLPSDTSATPLYYTIVQVYQVALDPTGYGEGKVFLGAGQTDDKGKWHVNVPPSPSGCYTAFATDVANGIAGQKFASSEFGPSSCRALLPVVTKG